jgi:hypothetical protein
MVRAGAVERAWELFVGDGHAARTGDPAVQAVLGRLLKARARLARGPDQTKLFAAAAEAYGKAHALGPAPYLAINAATLHLLAGDEGAAQEQARAVLSLLDSPLPPADTPYFLAATRAEAAYLLGDAAGAERAMEQAARQDPDGWHDRATTIAQLREIADARGVSASWLERFSPPASLHFAGHMGLVSGGLYDAQLAAAVDRLIAAERIGFGWGALAAGSDVVIAERLLMAGAEVHLVLPCSPNRFEVQSVAPAGGEWLDRYRAVLARAASLRLAASDPAAVHDPLATAHAGELAIGAALLNAATLSSRCCQLIVTDAEGGGRNTARQARMWPATAGPQHQLTIARDATIEALFPPEQPDLHRALVVHVCIALDPLVRGRSLDSAAIASEVAPIAEVLSRFERSRIRSAPGRWELVLGDVEAALSALADIQSKCREAGSALPAIGAHIAIASLIEDRASGAFVPYGPGMALAARLQAMAPPGLTLLSDALAVTMIARGVHGLRTELYHPGDEDSDGAVHVQFKAGQ